MISISDDQSLPLDVDGTLNPAASSMAFDNTFTGDTTFQGGVPNLNSSGRVPPHHRRTMKDQETQLQELKKENFGLKLRIYHMEEALQSRWGVENPGWKMNVELQVQLDELRQEVKDKEALLVRAKAAIDTMTQQHEGHVTEMQGALDKAGNTDGLKKAVQERDGTIALLRQQLEEMEDKWNELEAVKESDAEQCLAAKRNLSMKTQELEALQREYDDLHRNCTSKEKEVMELRAELSAAAGQFASTNADVGRLKSQNEQMGRVLAERTNEVASLQAQLSSSGQQSDQLLQLRKDLGDKDRKILVLDRALQAKEAELAEVQKALGASQQSSAQVAKETSARQQQCDEDIVKLNHAVRQLQDSQRQYKQAIDEKDAVIKKLQGELAGAMAKLNEADSRLIQLSITQAAEMGILRGKTEELERMLEQKEKQLKAAREELDAMRIARDTALKDLERARLKSLEIEYQMKQLVNELKNKADQLARTEHDLEQARLAVNQQREAQYSAQEAEAELVRLKSQNEDLQHSLQSKEAELASLKESIQLKDQVTKELLARQQKLLNQKAELEAMKNDASKENQKLTHELQHLQQQLTSGNETIQQLSDHVSSVEQTMQQLTEQLRMKDIQLVEALKKLQEASKTPLPEASAPSSVMHFLQSIVQGLHSVQNEIAAGRHDSTQASSSIKSQLSQLAELQRQLAELSQERDNTTPGLSIYTVAPGDSVITPADSVASLSSSDDGDGDDIPPLAAGESLLSLTDSPTEFGTKAAAKITDLQVELEEVKRLNESLHNQLGEYDRLHAENEQQKQEYKLEHDNLAKQVVELQTQLQLSEARSQKHLTSDAAGKQELEELRNQVEQLSQRCKTLEALLQKANMEIQRLKGLQTSPRRVTSPKHTLHVSSDKGLQISPIKSPSKSSPIAGSVKALQEKYHESIRLNQELQERLHAQLKTTPPSYTPDSFTPSPGTSPRKQEAEIVNLKQTISSLQEQLDRVNQDGNDLRQQLLEAKQSDGRREKEVERLQLDLASAEKKVSALEKQLDKILKDKNAALENLTSKNSALSDQLNDSLADLERLKSQPPILVDDELKEQLASALKQLGELKKRNSSLSSQLMLLTQQLSQKDQQLASLQKELCLYQQLLEEKGTASPLIRGKGQASNILKLLEEVRGLRDQLGAGIQSNAELSNELRKKLEENGGSLDLSAFDIKTSSLNGSPPHGLSGWPKTHTLISSPTGEDEPDFVEPVFDHKVGSRSFETRPQPAEVRSRKRTVDSSVSCASPGVDKMIQTITEAEGRLKQALESSGIQGIDRSFLEELLRYLEQQRKELDEGRQLLSMLDGGNQHSGEVPFRLDLSKIYEQLLQAKALAGESKSILQNKHYRTQKPKKL